MTTSTPGAGRRIVEGGRGVVLLVVGAVIDFCGIANVPGAVTVSADGEAVTVTGFGSVLALLAVGCWVSVLWRRRNPMLVLALGGLLAIIGVSYVLLLVGAIAAARAHPARLRRLGVIVSAIVVLFVLRELLTPWGGALGWFLTQRWSTQFEPGWIIATVIFAVASLAIAAGIVLVGRVRARARQSDARAEQQQHRADDLNEQVIRQAERDRIARDMHDALAHRLSVVSLHAGALESATDGQAVEIARTVREQTHAALQDMRGLIGDLRSGPGEASPSTMRAIVPLLAQLRASGAVVTGYVVLEAPERASAQFDSAVHRIVQEALTNAIKHAPGAAIDVFVQIDPESGGRIRIVNALRPGAEALVPGGGNGTLGIRERAAGLDGTAWIGAHEGEFLVDVALPWQERVGGAL